MVFEVREVIRPAVGKQSLDLRPDSLVRVELRGISQQVFDIETVAFALELLNQLYRVLCPYLNFFQPR
jgi:hypothetical protein